MMENIDIQQVNEDGVWQLQNIGKQTFVEAFSNQNTAENMEKYLSEGFSINKLISELRDSNAAFYFAILDYQVVAYLKLNFEASQTELRKENAMEIERIYVLQDFQRKKIGQLLLDFAIQIGYDRQVDFVWLGVWEENRKAIHFYQKNNFEVFDTHIFKLGEDKQTDLLMKRNLKTTIHFA